MSKSVCLLVALTAALAGPGMADVLYSSMPSPVPPNVPSLGYEATSTAEFGQGIQLAGGSAATLTSADVLMSNWALESTYETLGTSAGFYVPLTLNLYNVGAGNTVGSLFDSVTTNAFIQWRPEASAGCGTGYLGGDGTCYNGLAQVVTFDLSGVSAPGQFIYGLAFNTTDYGANPTHVAGPYDSLNFGLMGDGSTSVTPSTGSDLMANSAYWNTSYGPFYGDGGAGGVGTFRLDANDWTGYDPAVTFNGSSVPEPGDFGMLAALLAFGALSAKWRRRQSVTQ
ncbi:MAG: hypothetical protein LAP40_00990 [Acidobacteriia bacterium]|nr:hypothetical protein [Terriglobia bacterium]